LQRNCFGTGAALRIALAADTVSIAIMVIVDNVSVLLICDAMDAPLDLAHFRGSLAA
jgi:hypothetical protein